MLPKMPLDGSRSYHTTYALLAQKFGKEKWIHRQAAIAYLNTRPEMPSPTSVASRISYMVRDGWVLDNLGNKRTRSHVKPPATSKRRGARRGTRRGIARGGPDAPAKRAAAAHR